MVNWVSNALGKLSARKISAGQPLAVTASDEAEVGRRSAASAPARLMFDDVSKLYGDRAALDGLSLEIAAGEIVCLLGPSGCGKTTLLRIAAGIERPSGGRVLISDREVAGPTSFVPPEKRGVGLMFQDFALFPHLSILDNVAFGLKALPREDARGEALRMLGRVDLDRYADQYPHILSGGQQQRVALARAIVPRPAVMLMDEPFSGLDVQLRDSMQDETLRLMRETRATSMIVTHHPEEAMRLGDRIAVMRAGKLVQVGRAEDLYLRPVDLFVARLFSEINEVPVRVSGGVISSPLGTLPARGLGDGPAILCIRQRGVDLAPDVAEVVDEARSGGPKTVRGVVRSAKFLGESVRYEVAVEGLEHPLLVHCRPAENVGVGGAVRLAIDADNLLVFPPKDVETA